MNAFPLMLNVTHRLALVVGGGPVGRRKATDFVEAGGRVRLVALEPRPTDFPARAVDWRTEAYRREHLDGVALVFAAATADVNRTVAADAAGRGLWVNSATDPGDGDFTVPAVVRRGNFLVAVSTGGAAPALARAARERLEQLFDERFAQWVALLEEIRPLVLARVADEALRREIFAELGGWRWLDRIAADGADGTRSAMLAQVWLILQDADRRRSAPG